MKSHKASSLFLNVEVKKTTSSSSNLNLPCEVIAVAPPLKATANKSKAQRLELHSLFLDFDPLLRKLEASREFNAKTGETCLVRFQHVRAAQHVLWIGSGIDGSGVNALGPFERLRRLGAIAAHKLSAEKIKKVGVWLDSFLTSSNELDVDPVLATSAFVEGFGLALYSFDKYISKPKNASSPPKAPFELVLLTNSAEVSEAMKKGLAPARAILRGTEICRDLGNEPSNQLSPHLLADEVKRLAKLHGLKCTVLDEKALKREKMGLLLGVGQGSVNPPCMIMLEHQPRKTKSAPKIAFVGKGITFDSGGISIKPSNRMEDMKYDMCGGAAVIGALVAAAEMNLDAHVIGVVGAAENMPDGQAIQPGNILVARSGKTVEISNTDAEGRLILADVLDYIQDLKPDYIIDLATLTGAVTITLGKMCAALMGNNVGFNDLVKTAAQKSGERVWELPLYEEYFDDLKSFYADMRNSGDSPAHGTAKGAMFLQQFIREDTKWVHLDIASVAYGATHVPYYSKKSGTGYGVRLLIELAKLI